MTPGGGQPPRRTRIKICGVRDEATAWAAIDAGADAVGFVFHPQSPRFIEPASAWEIVQRLPPFVTTVGLTVDLTPEAFESIQRQCPTDYAQLHGGEPPETVSACGPRLIRAIRFNARTIADDLARWSALEAVDAVLVDGSAGGEGQAFDWDALGRVRARSTKPVILAGGLTPANVGLAIATVRPFAVDVSSGVEIERGVKDAGLIRDLCDAVRDADRALNSG